MSSLTSAFGIKTSSTAKSIIKQIGNTKVQTSAETEGALDALGHLIKDALSGLVLPLVIIAVVIVIAIFVYKSMVSSGQAPSPSSLLKR